MKASNNLPFQPSTGLTYTVPITTQQRTNIFKKSILNKIFLNIIDGEYGQPLKYFTNRYICQSMLTKLFIGGFPIDADELDLARLLGPFGDISTIKIVRDRKTGHCKGYAFIEMAGRIAAENAIAALHETEMADRVLTLRIVEEEPTLKRIRPEEPGIPISATKVQQSPVTEIKKKRPRKAQLIQPVNPERKRDNLV